VPGCRGEGGTAAAASACCYFGNCANTGFGTACWDLRFCVTDMGVLLCLCLWLTVFFM
jgi:hypothetical protein